MYKKKWHARFKARTVISPERTKEGLVLESVFVKKFIK